MTDQQMLADEQDLYLEPKRRWPGRRWLLIGFAFVLVMILGGAGLALAWSAGYLFPASATPEPPPTATLVPTFTPPPQATTARETILSAWPSTSPNAPVGMIEVVLSLPAPARVAFQVPEGLRYWHGDLLQTEYGLAWNGNGPGEAHWYLFREPGADFPLSLEVVVNGQALAVTLERDTSATQGMVLE